VCVADGGPASSDVEEPVGRGGGKGSDQLKNLTPKESARAFLKAKPKCESAINDAAAKKGKGSISDALTRVSFLDANDLRASVLGQSLRDLKFPETGDEKEMNSSLNSHVGTFGKDDAITNYANHTIYYGSTWVTDHSLNPVDSTIVHELLHDLFQGDHKVVADALGLSTEGDDIVISRRITVWLDGGCKN
jgi:hypothetical protein